MTTLDKFDVKLETKAGTKGEKDDGTAGNKAAAFGMIANPVEPARAESVVTSFTPLPTTVLEPVMTSGKLLIWGTVPRLGRHLTGTIANMTGHDIITIDIVTIEGAAA